MPKCPACEAARHARQAGGHGERDPGQGTIRQCRADADGTTPRAGTVPPPSMDAGVCGADARTRRIPRPAGPARWPGCGAQPTPASPACASTPARHSGAEGRDVSSWGGGAGMTLLTTSMAIIHLNSAQIRKKGQFQPTLLMNAGRSADVASLAAALSYIELGSPDTAVETAPPFDPRVALDSLSEHRRKRGAQWGLDPGQAVDDLHRSLSKKGSSYDAGTGVSNGGSGGGTFSLEMIHELQKAYQNMVGQGIAEGGMERLQFRELLTRTHSLTPAVDGMDIDVGKIADRLFDTCDDSRSGRIDFREVRFIF